MELYCSHGIGLRWGMCRIGGRLRSPDVSWGGANGEIPLLFYFGSNSLMARTLSGGQFNWGGCLLKGNGGVQRFPQGGWKSPVECIGIRELDCETYKSSRGESRAK